MLKTPGSNNLVKKVFSIEGLVFLVVLVALGLSIAAMVKDCKDGFGDCVPNKLKDNQNVKNFCESCDDGAVCNYMDCPTIDFPCDTIKERDTCNKNKQCYYTDITGCTKLDSNLCGSVGGQSPTSSNTCTEDGKHPPYGPQCKKDTDCCEYDVNDKSDNRKVCCQSKYNPGVVTCQSWSACKNYTPPPPPPGHVLSNCNDDTDCESGYTCQKNPHPNPYTDLSDKICIKSKPSPVPPFPTGGFNPKYRKHSDDSHKSLNQVHVMDGDSDNDEVGSSKGPGPTPGSPGPPGNKGLTTGEIVGISVGGGLCLIVVIAIIWYVMKNKKTQNRIN